MSDPDDFENHGPVDFKTYDNKNEYLFKILS